ncbi:uncharacterized protein LOC132204549 [Neocloeon triangulifer]|uniref:uncharacterized protein LOC132204549 n=1 Tax=Neocloeon triangulifer TaxID=2078957 RepID=UPI00286F45AD|nr:uncharacterized protein LOC132204549 [Neocloeon triangulifer]
MSYNLPTQDPYLNDFFVKREYGDFTPFYITICICLVVVAALLLLNFIFCCCSEHAGYWSDINTGNQLLIPIWTRTPHNQLPLDISELEGKAPPPPPIHYPEIDPTPIQYSTASTYPAISASFTESTRTSTPPHLYGSREKRESDI